MFVLVWRGPFARTLIATNGVECVLEINFAFPIRLEFEIKEIIEGQCCLKTNRPLMSTRLYCTVY